MEEVNMVRRTPVAWLLVVVVAGPLQAQNVYLGQSSLKGNYYDITVSMNLEGELHIHQDGKVKPLPQTATAKHQYFERILEENKLGMVTKTARFYRKATVQIEVGNHKTRREIRPERSLMVAQQTKDGLLMFCPKGPLTRGELDLTKHFDSSAIPSLLPNKKVSIGDSWKVHNRAAQALCYFEGLTSQKISCKLEKVSEKNAIITIHGNASGIDSGAAVKLQISGTLQFDLSSKEIIALEWNQQDTRDQGPVSPAMKAKVAIRVARKSISPQSEINDFALVQVPTSKQPPEEMTNLTYTDPRGRFKLSLDRNWYTVAETKEHLVFRYMDRGDFVAQVTLTSWPAAAPGKHMNEEEFQKAMGETPGWTVEEIQEGREIEQDNGNYVYRLAATGELNKFKTVQYFYLVANPAGKQLVVVFTMAPAQAEKLGSKDLDLVRSIRLLNGK